jgi:hypothetical protein
MMSLQWFADFIIKGISVKTKADTGCLSTVVPFA